MPIRNDWLNYVMGIAAEIILLIICAFFCGLIAQKFGLPLILGYIVAGIGIGHLSGFVPITQTHDIELLAEIGVALLLFSIGLEFSFRDLNPVKHIALIGTPIQLTLTICLGLVLGKFLSLSWQESLWLGAIISLSSTMVILKTLMGQGLLGTLSSKVMIGILIIQDLAVVPMMVLLPQLSQESFGVREFGFSMLKATLFIAGMVFLGTRLLPKLLRYIAKIGSRELFIVAITTMGLGIGYLTYLLGLSFAFGAFAAGMILSESDYGHQALSDILPLRDLFGLLFFTSVGLLFDPKYFIENMGKIILSLSIICLFKGILFFILAKFFKYVNVIPLALGLGLFQVGEFSFVLARIGLSTNSIDTELYNLVFTIAILSMAITPLISSQTSKIYSFLKDKKSHLTPDLENFANSEELENHVVIAGGGSIGFQVAEALKKMAMPFVVIEFDHRRMEIVKQAGFFVIYGDAKNEIVLQAAKVAKAKMLVATFSNIIEARMAISNARLINENLKVVALASHKDFLPILRKLGVTDVILPEFEAGLEMTREVLSELNVPSNKILSHVETLKNKHYNLMHNDSVKSDNFKLLTRLSTAEESLMLEWFLIEEDSNLVDKTLLELEIRKKTGVSVVGVIRNDILAVNPDVNYRFCEGDKVAVIGSKESREIFRKL